MTADILFFPSHKHPFPDHQAGDYALGDTKDPIQDILEINYHSEPYKTLIQLGFRNIDFYFQADDAIEQTGHRNIIKVGKQYIHQTLGVLVDKNDENIVKITKVKYLGDYMFIASSEKIFVYDLIGCSFEEEIYSQHMKGVTVIRGDQRIETIQMITDNILEESVCINSEGFLQGFTLECLLENSENQEKIGLVQDLGILELLDSYSLKNNIDIDICKGEIFDFVILNYAGNIKIFPYIHTIFEKEFYGKQILQAVGDNQSIYLDANMQDISDIFTQGEELIDSFEASPINGDRFVQGFNAQGLSLGLVKKTKIESIEGF